jgi:hypothetical protein
MNTNTIQMWTDKLNTAKRLGLASDVARITRILDKIHASAWITVGTN